MKTNRPLSIIGLSALAAVAGAAHAASPLVDVDWLLPRLDDDNVVVIDLRKADDYTGGHIPGAISATYGGFGWREKVDGVIGMLPPVATINGLIGGLGVTPGKHVVIVPYGNTSSDVGAAARVYWTFQVLGHDEVSLLDGGHKAWTAQDRYLLQGKAVKPQAAAAYPGVIDADLLIDTVALLEQVQDGTLQPIDARPDDQWGGKAKHPKARIAGAIPSAKRLPQAELVDPHSGKFVAADQVVTVAQAYGWSLDGEKPLVSYCNTGHWAATAWFALSEIAQVPGVKLYDGSMVAWTKDEANPTINTPNRLEQLLKFVTGG